MLQRGVRLLSDAGLDDPAHTVLTCGSDSENKERGENERVVQTYFAWEMTSAPALASNSSDCSSVTAVKDIKDSLNIAHGSIGRAAAPTIHARPSLFTRTHTHTRASPFFLSFFKWLVIRHQILCLSRPTRVVNNPSAALIFVFFFSSFFSYLPFLPFSSASLSVYIKFDDLRLSESI